MAPHIFTAAMKKIDGNVAITPHCRGSERFAAEHWILSHPAASPCDLCTDPKYVWGYAPIPVNDFPKKLKPAPRYSLTTYIKKSSKCKEDGHLLKQRLDEYQMLYRTAPTDAWWGWDFFLHLPLYNI
jgi:hypothetical protein